MEDPRRDDSLTFQPCKEEDLAIIYRWRQEPHVREFYQREQPTWEGLREKFLPRLRSDSPTKCFLSCTDGPIGYIQTYRVSDWPDYAATIGEASGISVDWFIGEASYVGQGWGRRILHKFLIEVAFPLFPEEDVCWIPVDKRNGRAIRACKATGFRYARDIVEEGILNELLIAGKADLMTIE